MHWTTYRHTLNYIQAHLHPRTPIHALHLPTSIDTPRTFTSCRSFGWTQAHRHTHGCTVTPPCYVYTAYTRKHFGTFTHTPATLLYVPTPSAPTPRKHFGTFTHTRAVTSKPSGLLYTLATRSYPWATTRCASFLRLSTLVIVVTKPKYFLHFTCSPCPPLSPEYFNQIKNIIVKPFNCLWKHTQRGVGGMFAPHPLFCQIRNGKVMAEVITVLFPCLVRLSLHTKPFISSCDPPFAVYSGLQTVSRDPNPSRIP